MPQHSPRFVNAGPPSLTDASQRSREKLRLHILIHIEQHANLNTYLYNTQPYVGPCNTIHRDLSDLEVR